MQQVSLDLLDSNPLAILLLHDQGHVILASRVARELSRPDDDGTSSHATACRYSERWWRASRAANTSNAGALLLGQVDRGLGLVRRFAECFIDRRDPRYVEHQAETLVGQRIFGLASRPARTRSIRIADLIVPIPAGQ